MVTGGLLADDVFVEIITDGVHLSDPMIELIARMKGPDRVMVITDAIRAAAHIPDSQAIVAVIALGYRAQDPATRPRKALEEIIAYL